MLLCVSFSNQAFAEDPPETEPISVASTPFDMTMITTGSPTSLKDLAFKIMRFLNLTIAGVSLIGVMGGGIMLIVSAGSESLMQKGKDILKYSIIGLVVTLSAYLIVTLVQTILGTLDL